jgi:hypothetical protein
VHSSPHVASLMRATAGACRARASCRGNKDACLNHPRHCEGCSKRSKRSKRSPDERSDIRGARCIYPRMSFCSCGPHRATEPDQANATCRAGVARMREAISGCSVHSSPHVALLMRATAGACRAGVGARVHSSPHVASLMRATAGAINGWALRNLSRSRWYRLPNRAATGLCGHSDETMKSANRAHA